MRRVVLLPGLGADPRMFAPQRAAMPQIEAPAWIPHVHGESLREYAGRLARTLDVREPIVIGGVSLGGMIALEIARVVPVHRVILIASCRSASAAGRWLVAAERLSRLAPDLLLDRGRALGPAFLGRGGQLSREHRRLLVRMAQDLPVSFLRWAGRAAVEWQGCEDPGAPVSHIHGDRDWVFPIRRVRPDCVVPGGIHVLNLSHPAEVNVFIARAAGLEKSPGSEGPAAPDERSPS